MSLSKKQIAVIVSSSILGIVVVVLVAIPLTGLVMVKLTREALTPTLSEIESDSSILTDGKMEFFDPGCVPLPWVKRLDDQKEYAEKIISCLDAMWRPAIDQESSKGMSIPNINISSPSRPSQLTCGTPSEDEETSFYCNPTKEILIWKYMRMTEGEMARVVAHEYSHHIQNHIGMSDSFTRMLSTLRTDYRAGRILHKRYEAQAECIAGFSFKFLLPDMADQFLADHDRETSEEDIDDTHPSYSNNRMWFERGMEDITLCNTWSAPESEVL